MCVFITYGIKCRYKIDFVETVSAGDRVNYVRHLSRLNIQTGETTLSSKREWRFLFIFRSILYVFGPKVQRVLGAGGTSYI